MTSPASVRFEQVRKRFGATEIVRGVDLEVRSGERHAIIGPNGAGKSVLFNLITARFAPTEGKIALNGGEITGRKPHEINRLGLARSFQVTNLFPRMSVFENIRCGLLWSHGYGYSFWKLLGRQTELNLAAEQLLELLKLSSRCNLQAGLLSYAEQRALEIGITIAGGAGVILLDEPCSALDPISTARIEELIHDLKNDYTVVIVTHNMQQAARVSQYTAFMYLGEMVEFDETTRVFTSPRDKRTQDYVTGRFG